jgi:ribosome assembly protein YihI (activator of Der GTPase)
MMQIDALYRDYVHKWQVRAALAELSQEYAWVDGLPERIDEIASALGLLEDEGEEEEEEEEDDEACPDH